MKKRINITVETEIAEKAHELGLNVSKTCENALKQAIKALEQTKIQTETNGGYVNARGASPPQDWCSGRDLNPGRRLSPLF